MSVNFNIFDLRSAVTLYNELAYNINLGKVVKLPHLTTKRLVAGYGYNTNQRLLNALDQPVEDGDHSFIHIVIDR